MRNRDIVFALKMVNRSKPGLTSFAGDFRKAAREASDAAKSIGGVSAALDRVGSSATRSGAQIGNATNNMRKALVTVQQQAKQTQSALQATFALQPGANSPRRRQAGSAAAQNARSGLGSIGNRSASPTMQGAASTIGSGFDKARQSVLGVQTAIQTLVALTAGGLGVKAVLNTADTYTQLQGQLKLVTKSQDELNAVYERTFAISQNTRQDVGATVNLYARLVKSTESVGYSANTLLGVTETVNKALATTPGPAASAQAALFQLSQGLATGTLRGEELNSVLEQAPRLAKAIADGMGVPVGSLRKLAEQNKITTETIVEALVKQKDVIDKEFGQLDKTAGQAFTVLGNAVVDFVGRADKATGATSAFANMITSMAERLRDPSLMAGAIRGMELFSSALSGMGTAVTTAIANIDLVLAALSALAVRAAFPIFAGMITGAVQLASALVALASGAGLAATGFTALQLSLGVIGVVLSAVAAAYVYYKTRSSEASASTDKFREAVKAAAAEGKTLTDVIAKMSEAQRFRAFNELSVKLRGMTPEFEKTGRAIRGMFGEFDKAPIKENAPFQQAIDAFNASIREGKPNVEAFVDAVGKIGAESGDKAIQARSVKLTEYIKKYGEMAAEVKTLQTQIDGLKPKAMDEVLSAKPAIDGARALKAYAEQLKELNKVGGQNKELQSALDDVEKATSTYANALKELDKAYQAGTVSGREYQQFLSGAKKAFEDVQQAVLGVTEAQKAMQKLAEQNRIDGMEDGRVRKLAEINQKYREQAETITKSVHDQGEKTKLLTQLEAQRAVAIGNIDAAYKNGAFADRLRDLENEQRLIGMTGEERDRLVKKIELEGEARKAGVSDIQSYVNAYMAEYDKLKRLQEADNTFGRGFSNAMKSYISETKNVAKESERLWSGVFSKLEDGFVEVVTTGKLNFQNLLSGLAQDFARFASRQLLNSLMQSLTSATGTGSGGGNFFSSLISGIGSFLTGKSGGASTAASGASSVASAMANGGTGASTAISAIANTATTSLATTAKTVATGMDAAFSERLGKMMEAIPGISVTSGFRSFEKQTQLWNSALEKYGSPELARKWVAPPGNSQHEKGMAADLSYASPAVRAEAHARASEFGLNFPLKNENWHIEPIGGRAAGAQQAFQQSPLNYTSDMSKYTLDQSTVDSLNKQFGDISNSASGIAPGLGQLDQNLTQTAANIGTSGTQLNSGMQQASTAVQTSGTQIGTSLTTTAAATTTGGVAVGAGLTTTATTVTAGGVQVGAALQTAAANISASGSGGGGGIFGGITKAIGGFFGLGSSGVAESAVGLARVGFNHKGGLAGRNSGMSRSMAMDAFAGALRFHRGGLARRASDAANAGLGSNEAAIIAEKNEAILPTVRLPNGQFGVSAANVGTSAGNTMTVGDINITVQGGEGGSSDQSQQQAKSIAKEVRSTFKGLIAEWSQDQSRPGGVLFRGT